MSPELAKQDEVVIYDANAAQRYEFQVDENGSIYDTAHRYHPLNDIRYIEYLKAFKAVVGSDEADENEIEAVTSLFNDLIIEVENFETEGVEDWKSLIDYSERRESLIKFLAVEIVDPERKSSGKRQAAAVKTETVATEAYFNGVPVAQIHVLHKKNRRVAKKI